MTFQTIAPPAGTQDLDLYHVLRPRRNLRTDEQPPFRISYCSLFTEIHRGEDQLPHLTEGETKTEEECCNSGLKRQGSVSLDHRLGAGESYIGILILGCLGRPGSRPGSRQGLHSAEGG